MRRRPFRIEENDPALDQAALVRDMVAGDKRAWREFHARYDRLIFHCINKAAARFALLGGEDHEDEIYATLLVQLLAHDMRKLRSFDVTRGNRLGSFIGMLAINCVYDRLRVVRREPERASLDECGECEEMFTDEPTPHEALERKEDLAQVSAILADFPEKDREFVTLYFAEGLGLEQIAERMHVSVRTVYSKKHKIQCRLEARLTSARLAA
jgi:RNA polymerase sigma-70 factor (ECF subfamily)